MRELLKAVERLKFPINQLARNDAVFVCVEMFFLCNNKRRHKREIQEHLAATQSAAAVYEWMVHCHKKKTRASKVIFWLDFSHARCHAVKIGR
jgi:hypothetical protein